MSDSKAESSVTISQKPVPKIKDISMMKAWKDSKVSIDIIPNRSKLISNKKFILV
jgi:hypothetical protein